MRYLAITLLFIGALCTASFGQNTMTYKKAIHVADSLFFVGSYKEAQELFNKTLKDTSKNSVSWARAGFSNLNQKNYDGALKQLEKSIALHAPVAVRVNVFASLARVYSVKNNKSKALTLLDSAVKLGYSNLNLLDTHADYTNLLEEPKYKQLRQLVYTRNFPCMANSQARQFDFWIGEWVVYITGTQTLAGNSKIEMIAGGCALLENWDSKASNGKSLNFVDPITNKWKQTWVGSYVAGIQEFVEGEYKDGAMRFTFETNSQQGNKVMGRFIFYNEKTGQVRQFNETSSDGGKSWTTSYDYTYVLKK